MLSSIKGTKANSSKRILCKIGMLLIEVTFWWFPSQALKSSESIIQVKFYCYSTPEIGRGC